MPANCCPGGGLERKHDSATRPERLDFLKARFRVGSAGQLKLTIMRKLSRAVTILGPLSLGAALLTACSTGPGNLRIHEVTLSGGANERLAWVYGTLSGGSSSVKLGGAAVDLRAQVQDALATPGSLSVNGQATYKVSTPATTPKLSVTRTAAGLFNVTPANGAALSAVYYTDGKSWWKLNGVSGTTSAQSWAGLRGAGQLTDDEGDALGRALAGQGSLAVAVLSETLQPLAAEPKPTEWRGTALYILPGIQTVPDATTGTTGSVTMNPNSSDGTFGSPVPAPTAPSTPLTPASSGFSEVARGTNATVQTFTVQAATTSAQLQAIYALAYGRQTGMPTPISLNNETAVAVFMGQRNTGGYSVNVLRAVPSGNTLTVTVSLKSPQPGMLTTQALTSPWVLVKVPGVYSTVTVVDSEGKPLR